MAKIVNLPRPKKYDYTGMKCVKLLSVLIYIYFKSAYFTKLTISRVQVTIKKERAELTTQSVCHKGCRSEALSGNMVEYYGGGVLHLSITFDKGWGCVWGEV